MRLLDEMSFIVLAFEADSRTPSFSRYGGLRWLPQHLTLFSFIVTLSPASQKLVCWGDTWSG